MDLYVVDESDGKFFLLERGRLLVLAVDARYKLRQGIQGRKTDTKGEPELKRGRRDSLTFRTIITDGLSNGG